MFPKFLPLVAQVLALVCSVTSDIRYVRPADSPLSSCPGQPCLTLHEYVEIDNFTNGTTLLFLPGNHTLQHLYLERISDITLASFNRLVTKVICKDNISITCDWVSHLHIVRLSFVLGQRGDGSALQFSHCKSVVISDTVFQGSEKVTGRAIKILDSEATIFRCMFRSLTYTGYLGGGAIYSDGTDLSIYESSFINNAANNWGGAVYASASNLLLNETTFDNNTAQGRGGAISSNWNSQVEMVGTNAFNNNNCQDYGGAMHFSLAQLNITRGIVNFTLNEAGFGGAITLFATHSFFSGSVNMLKNKAVHNGGAMYIYYSLGSLAFFKFVNFQHLTLIENAAGSEGGAMYVSRGDITLHGNIILTSNMAKIGGGIRADRSIITITGYCSLSWNSAKYGGAMNTLYGTVSVLGPTQLTHNTAEEDGGAMVVAGTVMQILKHVHFSFNSAQNGGAMFFENGASLNLSAPRYFDGRLLTSLFNFAQQNGGAMYHRDNPSISQCSYSDIGRDQRKLPDCYLQFQQLYYTYYSPIVVSVNDSAGREGDFMFGGLMDRCKVREEHGETYLYKNAIFIYPGSQPTKREVSSKPYSLCLCSIKCIGSEVMQVEVYRGQKFKVPLLAKMQYGTTATIITAITSSTARLETYQTSQPLPDYCALLNYSVYSNESHEQVVLYPDGPCRDTGTARVVIDVTLLPCPDGFTQSGEICTCEDRLHDYPVNCTIADTPYLTKATGYNFWIGVFYVNATFQGLVLCKSCPAEYCKKGVVIVTIDNLDTQCDSNRTGLLCGACAANHSLMLGSSQCQVCLNTYLALLLPFAAAGVALVIFLTSLRLTMATGTVNSVILYANILQVKRNLFFSRSTRNPLTVLLAWMNLDLGFQTCFYDGLDAYALTWLQFAFPLYVWLIIGLMIFISRYSITVSKLIGSNPVAVLATLLLMSYTKILKIIIEVYSYENLDYPDNKTVPVWLKDANVPYLESKHLFLTVFTSSVLIFLFFPYTILLLLGHKLYRFTGKKHWRWFNRVKPLLDSYYAPYKNHTRYWTGLLLLVRCILYVIFSVSSTSKNLAAIMLIFAVIGFLVGFGRIYKSMLVNLIEAGVYLNLIVLSVTALIGLNSPALVYSLVGLVFVVMMALIAHQFHLFYIAKTALWLRLKSKWPQFRKVSPEVQISINPSHDQHKLVTRTVIDLREPLLDS